MCEERDAAVLGRKAHRSCEAVGMQTWTSTASLGVRVGRVHTAHLPEHLWLPTTASAFLPEQERRRSCFYRGNQTFAQEPILSGPLPPQFLKSLKEEVNRDREKQTERDGARRIGVNQKCDHSLSDTFRSLKDWILLWNDLTQSWQRNLGKTVCHF